MSVSLELQKSLPAGHHLPMRSPVLTPVGGGFRLGNATGAVLPAALFLAGCQRPNSLPIEAWEPMTVKANSSHLGQQPQAARHVIAQHTGAPGQPSHPKSIRDPRAKKPWSTYLSTQSCLLSACPVCPLWLAGAEHCVDKEPWGNPGHHQLCPDIPCSPGQSGAPSLPPLLNTQIYLRKDQQAGGDIVHSGKRVKLVQTAAW